MITNIIKRPLVKFVRNLSILSQQPKLTSGNSSMRLTDTSFTIQHTTKTNTIVLQKRNSAHEPHTLTTVKDRIMLVLNLYDKIDNSKLTMDSDFFMDLGLDSLDFVEVILAIEEEFSFEIPDGHSDKMRTPRDIYLYICDKLDIYQ